MSTLAAEGRIRESVPPLSHIVYLNVIYYNKSKPPHHSPPRLKDSQPKHIIILPHQQTQQVHPLLLPSTIHPSTSFILASNQTPEWPSQPQNLSSFTAVATAAKVRTRPSIEFFISILGF